jgi:hypothetical protein
VGLGWLRSHRPRVLGWITALICVMGLGLVVASYTISPPQVEPVLRRWPGPSALPFSATACRWPRG